MTIEEHERRAILYLERAIRLIREKNYKRASDAATTAMDECYTIEMEAEPTQEAGR